MMLTGLTGITIEVDGRDVRGVGRKQHTLVYLRNIAQPLEVRESDSQVMELWRRDLERRRQHGQKNHQRQSARIK